MLPAQHRLRSSADFASVLRRHGRIDASSRILVVHAQRTSGDDAPSRIGFVVSKAVGNAVIRNRTRRRLREQCRARLAELLPGTDYVIRARPAAALASSAELGSALDIALARVTTAGAGARR